MTERTWLDNVHEQLDGAESDARKAALAGELTRAEADWLAGTIGGIREVAEEMEARHAAA